MLVAARFLPAAAKFARQIVPPVVATLIAAFLIAAYNTTFSGHLAQPRMGGLQAEASATPNAVPGLCRGCQDGRAGDRGHHDPRVRGRAGTAGRQGCRTGSRQGSVCDQDGGRGSAVASRRAGAHRSACAHTARRAAARRIARAYPTDAGTYHCGAADARARRRHGARRRTDRARAAAGDRRNAADGHGAGPPECAARPRRRPNRRLRRKDRSA